MTIPDQAASEREKRILEQRLEYLAKEYRPTQNCIDAGLSCDFTVDEDDKECVCQWALKMNPDCFDILPPKGKP